MHQLEVMCASVDFDEHFIHVPSVAESRTLAAQAVSISLSKLQAPLSDSLIRKSNAVHAHHLFDIAVLKLKRKYNHTQWLMISEGKRWRRYREAFISGLCRVNIYVALPAG